ncbi:MAG: MlaD family protein [Thermoanaerobaculia bacterium]
MSSAAKVGAFMLVILAILAYFILKIEDIGLRGATTRKISVVFDSAAGLNKKTDVRMAGVPVGKVEDITLRPDGKALVTLDVDARVPLRENATARIANLGLLGEKYVELDPGTPNTATVPAGDVTLRGSQPPTIDDVTSQVASIATDIKAITESLRKTMSGPTGQQRLEDIVENVRAITVQVRELIAANRTNVDATVGNMRAITEDLRVQIPKIAASIDRVANTVGGTVGENREDVRQIVENLRKLSTDLKTTTDNLNAITGQVKTGEGTVGRLIYSNEAHDKLTAALTSVEGGVNELKNTLGRANRIALDVGIKADYYSGLKEDPNLEGIGSNSRSAVTVRLVPNPERNRFYNIELADDPRGHVQHKIFQEDVTDPNTGVTTTKITKETKFDRNFLVSAQAGWVLNATTVRLGLIDSTGGAGVDYQLNNRIRVTGEAFDFGKRRDNNAHLRLFGEYTLRSEKPRTPLIFVATGVDNVLNDTAFTFGGGIRWRDEDLKYLIGSIPIGK